MATYALNGDCEWLPAASLRKAKAAKSSRGSDGML